MLERRPLSGGSQRAGGFGLALGFGLGVGALTAVFLVALVPDQRVAHAQGPQFVCPLAFPGTIRAGDDCAREGGRFGARRGATRIHGALDIDAPEGTPVVAAAAGRLVVADLRWGEMGGTVLLDHNNGWYSIYGHLATITAADGRVVAQGEPIGTVGYTGNARCLQQHQPPLSAHLHFALLELDRPGVADTSAPLSEMRRHGAVLDALAGASGAFGLRDPEVVLRGRGCW